MTARRQESEVDGSELDRRAIPLSSIWAQVTSDFDAIFTPDTTTSASFLDVSTPAQPTPTRTISPNGEMTTESEVIPISTVTVEKTSLSTTFVTVRLTTDLTPTYAPASSTGEETTSSTASASAAVSPSNPTSNTEAVPIPTLVTSIAPSATFSGAPSANTQNNASASSATADGDSSQGSQKHAIIGGLSGSIAGIVLIGIIACLFWRRRKPRFEDDDDAESEKGLRPIFARKWSELTSSSRAPRPPPAVISHGTTPEPEMEGQILRVSLDNWARPYAHDQGYRESQGPTTLRVMNPDLSRPTTPLRPSLETAGSFLKRQRNALAAALYGRPSSRADSPQRNPQVPPSNIDPALSTEFLAPKAIAPSVRSASTNTSTVMVVHQPPEDPFLTPPDETEERTEYTTKPAPVARPGIAPLQGAAAAGGLGRTLSHLGNSLNPFRTRSNASASSRSVSRHSTSTFSSAGDPFHLQSNFGRPANDLEGRGRGNVALYEGT